MRHRSGPRLPDDPEEVVEYIARAGIAIAVGLAMAVVLLAGALSVLPSGPALGTLVFTLLLLVAAGTATRLHRSRTRGRTP
jgi:hypothetical protein